MSYRSSLIVISSLICFAGASQTFAQKSFVSLPHSITQIEQMAGLKSVRYEESVPYQTILSNLQATCSPQDISLGHQKYINFINNPKNSSYFANKSNVRKMLKFNSTKNLILRASTKEESIRCVQKYFLYQLLEKIQGSDVTSYPFGVTNDNASLQSDEKVFSHLAQFYIQDRMQRLVKEGIIQPSDLSHLDNKIIIQYVRKCGNVHGSYHMLVSASGEKTVNKIIININICTSENYLSNFKKYVDQLFVHELAHYLYYFKDDTNKNFENICRKNNKNVCNSIDFVTKYAQSSKEEDYAESFSYWYLMIQQGGKHIPTSNESSSNIIPTRISRKTEYFGTLFKIV